MKTINLFTLKETLPKRVSNGMELTVLDCEQSLSFPSVLRDNKIARDRSAKGAAKPREARARRKRKKKGFFRASPYSPLVPSPHLHIFGFSCRS